MHRAAPISCIFLLGSVTASAYRTAVYGALGVAGIVVCAPVAAPRGCGTLIAVRVRGARRLVLLCVVLGAAAFADETTMDRSLGVTGVIMRAPVAAPRGCGTLVAVRVRGARRLVLLCVVLLGGVATRASYASVYGSFGVAGVVVSAPVTVP